MSNKAEKMRKQALKDQQKRMKPSECMKYVRLVLDVGLQCSSLGQSLLEKLATSDLTFELRSLPAKNCIIWERNVVQQTLTAGAALGDAWHMEPQVLLLYSEKDLEHALKTQTLTHIGPKLHESFSMANCQFAVVVPRLRPESANALTVLQLLQQLHVEQLSKPLDQELMALLQRYTKAIAESSYKQQRNLILGIFKKYLANDNKQCVRVDENNGYGRLWQQHLNRLPQVTLEVAESIIAQYPSPKRMLQHFASDPQAVQAMSDVRIKRNNGPLALCSDRRIGNVLSTKLYTLYNARDPNELI